MSIPSEVLIEVTTESRTCNYQKNPQLQFPTVKLNGQPLPPPKRMSTDYSPSGFLAVVINSADDYTNPANLLVNVPVPVWPQEGTNLWPATYGMTYDVVVNAVLNAGNIQNQLLILASYGLDNGMTPTNDALDLCLSFGAGEKLQIWEKTADTGSQGGPNSWVNIPANYVLVGFRGLPYAQGWEQYQKSMNEVQTTLTVTLPNGG